MARPYPHRRAVAPMPPINGEDFGRQQRAICAGLRAVEAAVERGDLVAAAEYNEVAQAALYQLIEAQETQVAA